jgi:5-methylcytosine-specific restriction endonuclease McrA
LLDYVCISRKFPAHYEKENLVKEEFFVLSKKGKPMRRVRFPCAICGKKVSRSSIRRDHIDPVINPETGFPLTQLGEDDWNVYIKRLFCSGDNIQLICKPCHDGKTKKEKKERVVNRKKLTKRIKKDNIKL